MITDARRAILDAVVATRRTDQPMSTKDFDDLLAAVNEESPDHPKCTSKVVTRYLTVQRNKCAPLHPESLSPLADHDRKAAAQASASG